MTFRRKNLKSSASGIITVCFVVCNMLTTSAIVYPQEGTTWNIAKIKGNEAWDLDDISTYTHIGSNSIIIAVLDSGINLDPSNPSNSHEDLASTLLWRNMDEEIGDANGDGYPGIEGVDDDGDQSIDEGPIDDDDENGYVDDLYGYNFVDDTSGKASDLVDDGWCYAESGTEKLIWDNHGTRVAGLIGATVNNGIGITGVTPNIKVMVLKIGDDNEINSGSEFNNRVTAALIYALYNGADIISMSFETSSDLGITSWIDTLYNKGVSIFASSGCDGSANVAYPASLKQIVAVGAIDSNEKRASYSSYAAQWSEGLFYNNVEVVAPSGDNGDSDIELCNDIGSQKYVSWPSDTTPSPVPNGFVYEGTHYAVPQVSATAALILSYYPTLTPGEVRRILQISAKDIKNPEQSGTFYGQDAYTGYGCIDVNSALQIAVRMKCEFLQKGVFMDPTIHKPTEGTEPTPGYEPSIDIDCNGYIHGVVVTDIPPTDTGLMYFQYNINLNQRTQKDLFSGFVAIPPPYKTRDPAISVDTTDSVNIAWRKGDYEIYFSRLDFNGNFLTQPVRVKNYPLTEKVSSLNLLSNKDGDLHWLIYQIRHTLWWTSDKIQIDEINNAGILTGNQYTLWDVNNQKNYRRPSADKFVLEIGSEEYISVMYDINNKNIGLFTIKDNLQTVTMSPVQIDSPYPFSFVNPDLDVDYLGGQVCAVFRAISPTSVRLKYVSVSQDFDGTNFLTYKNDVMDVTHELPLTTYYFFNPQISINKIRNECRIVFEHDDHVATIGITRDGRPFQHLIYGHRNEIPKTIPGGGNFNFAFPQIVSTDIYYTNTPPNGRLYPYDNDGNFHMMQYYLSLPGIPPKLEFYTTRAVSTDPQTVISDAEDYTGPDIVTDDKNGKHILYSDYDEEHDKLALYYSYYKSSVYPPSYPTIGPLRIEDIYYSALFGQISVSMKQENLDENNVLLIAVHIVWERLVNEGPEELRFTQIDINTETYQYTMNINNAQVKDSDTYEVFYNIKIQSYTDYSMEATVRPVPPHELLVITWNDNEDAFFIVIDWQNSNAVNYKISDGGQYPEVDIDACGNIYFVYELNGNGYLSKWEIDILSFEWARAFTDVQLGEKPDSPNFIIYRPKIMLDNVFDRTNSVDRVNGDFKNNDLFWVHVIYDANQYSLVSGHHLYYLKYTPDGTMIIPPTFCFPPNAEEYNYYSSIIIDARMVLSTRNEIGIVFSSPIQTDIVSSMYGYEWEQTNLISRLWFILLTNNGQIKSNPVFINLDEQHDTLLPEISATVGNTFEIIYLQDIPSALEEHLRWITVGQVNLNFKMYI